MSIKLVALDLDGTLLDSKKRMPVDFLPWVREHENVRTVISSGRQYYTILRDFPLGQDKLTVIAENGGLVFDENGNKIYANPIKYEDVKKSLDRIALIPGACPIICGENSAYMPESDEESFEQASIFYARVKKVDDLYKCAREDSVLKIAVFFKGFDAAEKMALFTDLPDAVAVVLSGERWVDVANSDVNKGTAVKFLLEKYGIDRTEASAFGDYLNDYDMLRAVEESYCMMNGHPDLKAIAKHIAPSNDEDGVMKVLKSLL